LPLATIVHDSARPGPHLLITGGVHGDEFEPMQAVRRLGAELPTELIAGRVTLVPVVNEPAFRRRNRTAEDELDLARTCPGCADGSVTQRIAAELSRLIQSADYYIDLHTGGTRLTVHPLAGYMLHRDPEILAKQRRMARVFGLPIVWGTDPNLNGRSLSVARDARVPAMYAEYLGGGRCDPQGVEAYVLGCRNVLIDLQMLEGVDSLPADHDPLVVEDPRPDSGHMQIQHPAPTEGFFVPQVKLGQRIARDQTLGTVCDVLGRQTVTVTAQRSGLVLVLHTFSRVEQNESLAVILELPQ
jgi:predicted deacylase